MTSKSGYSYSGYWKDICFVPAPMGWRVVNGKDDESKWTTRPLAGWLTQIWEPFNYRRMVEDAADDDPDFGDTQIVPVECSEGHFENVREASNFIFLLAPGEPEHWKQK